MISLRESWEATQRKSRRPAVLANGIKWREIQTSAVDMEFNATREAVLAEVARIFRIPPWLMGLKSDPSTYQNVEQASLSFLIHTLQPWLTRFEIALSSIFPGVKRNDPFRFTSKFPRIAHGTTGYPASRAIRSRFGVGSSLLP